MYKWDSNDLQGSDTSKTSGNRDRAKDGGVQSGTCGLPTKRGMNNERTLFWKQLKGGLQWEVRNDQGNFIKIHLELREGRVVCVEFP